MPISVVRTSLRLSILACCGLLLFCQSFAAEAATSSSDPLRQAVDRAVGTVKPALVRIHVVSTTYRDGREMKYSSSGSGAIITPEGHVITNHHVAGHATRLVCTLSTREEVEAELIGTDPLTDIAVIKLIPKDGRKFLVAPFGDSSKVKVGDQVFAMGSPLALSQSVTLGIISNNEMIMPRRMGFGSFRLDGEDVGRLIKWFAHDAVIYPGNSGGPLVNVDGEIIGINEISIGLGGAIPGNIARSVAESIMRDGKVSRSWIGMTAQSLLKHSGQDRGVLITGAIEGSPAADAGIESGDILLSMNGVDTTVIFDEQLPEYNGMLAGLPVGSEVELVVLRNEKKQTIKLTTIEREHRRPKQSEFRDWGLTCRNISFIVSKEMKRESQNGAIITSVRPGGPADDSKPNIRRGDVIVDVGGVPIANLDDLARATKDLLEGHEDPVSVLTTFERDAGSYVSVVEVGIRELNDPGLEVKKAWLPVETQVITRDIAELIRDRDLKGFRITQVYSESTAEKAGLLVGDLITKIDGEALTASAPEHYEELPTLIRNYRVGSTTELSVLRDGDELTVEVELMRAPMLNREMRKYRDDNFEYTARDITFFDKASEQWEQERVGVLISEVKSGGWAALGLLQVGDLLQEVQGNPVNGVDSLREIMEEIESDQPPSMEMIVLRGIYTVYVELEPKW